MNLIFFAGYIINYRCGKSITILAACAVTKVIPVLPEVFRYTDSISIVLWKNCDAVMIADWKWFICTISVKFSPPHMFQIFLIYQVATITGPYSSTENITVSMHSIDCHTISWSVPMRHFTEPTLTKVENKQTMYAYLAVMNMTDSK